MIGSATKTKLSDLARQLNGTWFNQLGSCLDLRIDDAGRVSGLFQSSVGGVDGGHEVTGFVAADPDGPDGAIGFAVAWEAAHSLTVWSGHYRREFDTIFTTWLLSEACSPHGEWRSTTVGHDEYRRSRVEAATTAWLASSAPLRARTLQIGETP
jgi:Avidin family